VLRLWRGLQQHRVGAPFSAAHAVMVMMVVVLQRLSARTDQRQVPQGSDNGRHCNRVSKYNGPASGG
jgi:hypothetical protein